MRGQNVECSIVLLPEKSIISRGIGSNNHSAKRQACVEGLRLFEQKLLHL